ncbi:MAG: DMT family transporter, partial [Paracoccaceae bacterium]|nr:DMT family transporter [Paracoccaceae bacterium]
ATCFFTAPIFVCLFATVILKETIGWRRVIAVCIGFLGVLFIIQPGATNMNFILIFPLVAGISYALAVIITRGFCREQKSFSLTFSHNIFYACLGLLMVSLIPSLPLSEGLRDSNKFLFMGWVPLTKDILLLIGATSITHIIAMTATIRAYQNADTSLVAPLEYFYLIFASTIDYLVWQVVLGPTAVMGIFLVVTSGIIISFREGITKNSQNKDYE